MIPRLVNTGMPTCRILPVWKFCKYGGIYADIDTLFINKLPDSFFEREFAMGTEKVDWTVTAGGSLPVESGASRFDSCGTPTLILLL